MLTHTLIALCTLVSWPSALAHPAAPSPAPQAAAQPGAAQAAPRQAAAQPAVAAPAAGTPPSPEEVLASLRAEAQAVRPLVSSDLARAFLAATAELPAPPTRVIWRSDATGRFLPDRAVAALDEAARAGWKRRELDAQTYYDTRYGSPLAYARALDVLAQAGLHELRGLRLLDFGYGTVGHLRLLALCGADASGVDVDSYLTALYDEPGDQGPVRPAEAAPAAGAAPTPASKPASPSAAGVGVPHATDAGTPRAESAAAPPATGRVTLHEGRWPADDAVRAAVGEGYDVFLSKNTLKRGYVHPSRKADPRQLIDLGVDDATYLARLHALLKPGALALIYNICPPEAGPDESWLPWSDGRSPFTREQWDSAGFELLAFDTVDSAAARAQGVALGWGAADEMEHGIFAWYTLARRRP